jgi:hypothetical protein
MEIVGFIFGIFGLMAYLELSSMKNRIAKLEEQLTRVKGTSYSDDHDALKRAARSCIGKPVTLELKEDMGDVDIMMYGNSKHGCNTILEVGDEWLLVQIDSPKGTKKKLLRIRSLERITMNNTQ